MLISFDLETNSFNFELVKTSSSFVTNETYLVVVQETERINKELRHNKGVVICFIAAGFDDKGCKMNRYL